MMMMILWFKYYCIDFIYSLQQLKSSQFIYHSHLTLRTLFTFTFTFTFTPPSTSPSPQSTPTTPPPINISKVSILSFISFPITQNLSIILTLLSIVTILLDSKNEQIHSSFTLSISSVPSSYIHILSRFLVSTKTICTRCFRTNK